MDKPKFLKFQLFSYMRAILLITKNIRAILESKAGQQKVVKIGYPLYILVDPHFFIFYVRNKIIY